ncbi:MAG: uroporphyrinogen decarboxylase [Gammaproteobacteria bacterium]
MSNQLINDRLLRALLRQPVDMTPIWIMRQAGRYLLEYREARKEAGDFLTLCKTPELACRVTLQPLERFPLDAAILFSDILTIPDAMGLGLAVIEAQGPQFASPVRTEQDIRKLGIPDPESDLRYVMDAVRLIRRELNGRVPLIGFSGSPWTLATYMVEGQASREFALIKGLLYEQPAVLHELLDKLAKSVSLYLHAQIRAGAQAVMIFDTWGGILAPGAYRVFSLAYMQRIVGDLKSVTDVPAVPVILFSKGVSGSMLTHIARTGCDAVGVDWTLDIGEARRAIGDQVALQGNLDPAVLQASPDVIRREAGRIIESFGAGSGHVFNLGHGITPEVNPENVGILVNAVHELSRPYHA